MRKINNTDDKNKNDIEIFCETALKHRKTANFFSSPEVLRKYTDCGDLYITETKSGIFIYADTGDFFRLYYALTDTDISLDLPEDIKPTVTETAYRGENPPDSVGCFINYGFKHSLTRSRMSLNLNSLDNQTCETVENTTDINAVLDLFVDSFDRYTGCIPTLAELEKAASDGRILTVVKDNILRGALFYEATETSASLSNIAVSKDSRGQGLGGHLVSSWINICKTSGKSVLRLWVADGNIAAVKLYEKHGFKSDGLKSVVLVKP